MKSFYFLFMLALLFPFQQIIAQDGSQITRIITPNDFSGSDIQRIQEAINTAKGSTNKITIPQRNSNSTNVWKIDSAILLPSDMTVILDNCIIQLSDQCRDNMFRSDNVGRYITDPIRGHNIAIVGVGNVILKGADNPRATGDGKRTLSLSPEKGRVSYGSDAGKEGVKQTSDWRNNMIEIAYVNGFELRNVTIKNPHAWAVNCERVEHAEITNIRFYNPQYIIVHGNKVFTSNKDGIDLRQGCKYFRIDNITGIKVGS